MPLIKWGVHHVHIFVQIPLMEEIIAASTNSYAVSDLHVLLPVCCEEAAVLAEGWEGVLQNLKELVHLCRLWEKGDLKQVLVQTSMQY